MDNADEEGCWKLHRNLGAGAFGVVELWKNDCTGNTMAIKKCKGGLSQLTEKQRERWISEVKTMNSLSHLNIVGTRKLPRQLFGMGEGVPVLCMEYCSRGDLRTVLNESDNCCGIKESEALKVMYHISSAVEYLHSLKLTHRDIKPENIVLQGTKEKMIYKLTDLGYARVLGEESLDASVVGTLNYLAPEVFYNPNYTRSVDYWSLGILFYEVITGNRPFLPNMPITATWIRCIEKKKYEHICARGDSRCVEFIDEIERPSTISDATRVHLTNWFRVALQWDPKRRGKFSEGSDDKDKLVIFSFLKDILSYRIVYVFVVLLYRIDSYVVSSDISVHNMQSLIFEKTGIEISRQTLTNCWGNIIDQADALFNCIEEPHLMVFQRDKFYVESPSIPKTPPSVRQMINRPRDKLDYHTIKRYYAAVLYFIKQELELFRLYVIALSIKIDLSSTSLTYLREYVQTLTTSAHSLMKEMILNEQSPEYGLMGIELKETFEETKAKIQKLLEGAQEVIAKLDVLSSEFELVKSFSDFNWLEKWEKLHEEAKSLYEKNLKRNPGQSDTPADMVKLVYSALKLHAEQMQFPEIKTVLSQVIHFDTNILQLQKSLNSFEALIVAYRKKWGDILKTQENDPLTTCHTLSDSVFQNNTTIIDSIMLCKLFDGALDGIHDDIMELENLDFSQLL